MKNIKKMFAIILTIALLVSALPLSFAQSDSVEDIVNADYENYLATGADAQDLTEGEDYVAGEILFNYAPGENNAYSLSSIEAGFGLEILETIDQSALIANAQTSSEGGENQTLYRAAFDSTKASVFELCKAMNELPTVTDCEPNYTYAPDSFVMPTEISSSSSYNSMQKWYFDNMNIPSTWQTYSNLGEGTLVCVIDNGLNATHNEIKNRLWDDGNGNHGYNAEFNNHDIYGKLDGGPAHGSHCAGIIGMEASNGGLVGVAPKATIMMCNAVTSSTGYFTNANLIKSLEYAVANGADVISMSLGGYAFSFNMEKALARASYSAVILCAAGNEGLNAATALHYPSASGAVIGVMALGSGSYTNRLSDYSNYDLTGRYYQVAAPGTDIYSISALSNTTYREMTGTSMATPFMAGIAALYVAEHPTLSPAEVRSSIIRDAGEMVQGYMSDAMSYSFKKATALTMLGQTCEPATQATFNDRIVYAKVKEALAVDNPSTLTNYDLESVTHLDLSNTSFKNYSELAKFPALTYLNLAGTNMSDADAKAMVQYLPDTLQILDVSDNELTNLDFLTRYSGYLTRLTAHNNAIKNIAGVSGFTMLTEIDLASNQIKDISAVSTLTGLKYLYVPGNLIEDATPVISVKSLEEVYFGNYNPNFTDMFGELYFLSGSKGNRITSLAPFMQLSKYNNRMHYINLSYNYVQYDSQYNYRAAKLIQLLDEIGNYYDFQSIFAENVKYKLVLSPCATGALTMAQDIVFENNKNYVTLSLEGEAQKIPYSVIPEGADYRSGVTFRVKDSSVAYVDSEGFVYPVNAGSTYITLTLDSGKVRTFYVNVKDTYVLGASIMNPRTIYSAGTSYTALVYTAPCVAIRLVDQNGTGFGEYTSSGKYCYALTDSHGNNYQKWIVPLSAEAAGNYNITVKTKATDSSAFATATGSFNFPVGEAFGYEVYGNIYAYNTRFDTTISLLMEDETPLQSIKLQGGVSNSGEYRFTNVAAGTYTIKIERDGYVPYFIRHVVVDGDTLVDDNIDTPADITSLAGDFNGDNVIDFADASILLANGNYASTAAGAQNILCDIDADEMVTVSDLSIVLANMAG
ncbi:MAG: S8 family serine peptidase [Clostridia bacterium]|nr:S8 family serine peptidase [Clostridia bacterium]